MSDKIDIIVAGVNRKDKKMWGDFYDRFYAALCVYVSKILPQFGISLLLNVSFIVLVIGTQESIRSSDMDGCMMKTFPC